MILSVPRSGRRRVIVALSLCGAAALAAAAPTLASSPAHPRPAPASGATAATGSGQTTVNNVLPPAARHLGSGLAGWSGVTEPTRWSGKVGHHKRGALKVTTAGLFTSSGSPSFAATPGDRYSAVAWVRAASTGHPIGVGLQFFDATGQLTALGRQLSQPVTDTVAPWRRTATVVGIAPPDAVTARVTVVSMDDQHGLVDFVDDVRVTQTSGTSAAIVGPLTTKGRDVIDANGHRVVLHGIQLGGLKNPTWHAGTITTQEVQAAKSWGANFARIPLAENPVLVGDCNNDPSYIDIVDQVVSDVTSRGMVALLDLHTNAITTCSTYDQQKMPDSGSVAFWTQMAARYKDNPLVAFDLYNEPHDVSDQVWRDGGLITSGTVTYVSPGMQKLYDTVRGTGATNLIVASGPAWATRYPSKAPLTGANNLIYGVHAYTCAVSTPTNGGHCYPGPGGLTDPSGILSHFAAAGKKVPVMITEFGYPDRFEGRYNRNAIDYAEDEGWVGWNVFVFDGTTSGPFDLVRDVAATWNPAQSGMPVILGMRND